MIYGEFESDRSSVLRCFPLLCSWEMRVVIQRKPRRGTIRSRRGAWRPRLKSSEAKRFLVAVKVMRCRLNDILSKMSRARCRYSVQPRPYGQTVARDPRLIPEGSDRRNIDPNATGPSDPGVRDRSSRIPVGNAISHRVAPQRAKGGRIPAERATAGDRAHYAQSTPSKLQATAMTTATWWYRQHAGRSLASLDLTATPTRPDEHTRAAGSHRTVASRHSARRCQHEDVEPLILATCSRTTWSAPVSESAPVSSDHQNLMDDRFTLRMGSRTEDERIVVALPTYHGHARG